MRGAAMAFAQQLLGGATGCLKRLADVRGLACTFISHAVPGMAQARPGRSCITLTPPEIEQARVLLSL